MSAHTPGRWTVAPIPSPLYTGIVAIVRDDVAVLTDGRPAYPSEWEANARLIAAAPDLLAVLREVVVAAVTNEDACPICLRGLDGPQGHASGCVIPAAVAAIARAEGR